MNVQQFQKTLKKYRDGQVSDSEEKALKNFENQMISKNENRVFTSEFQQEKIRTEISRKVFQTKRKRIVWQYAAMLIALLGVGSFFVMNQEGREIMLHQAEKPKIVSVKALERKEIILPDGSKVMLQQNSELSYNEGFVDEKRIVKLRGEAFFEVMRDETKPFVVQTGEVETEVLGTAFGIESNVSEMITKVSLASGKVQVRNQQEAKILQPATQAICRAGISEISVENIDVQEIMDRREGVLRFANTPIEMAVKKLERWYGITISLEKMKKNYRISGVFVDENLENVLQQITFAQPDLYYEINENKYVRIKSVTN